jgi:hypothetical protein
MEVHHTASQPVELKQVIIRFPDLRLKTRDAHKLRGWFGNLFKEYSPLLHNHFDDGSLRYSYPQVQYKVIGGIPFLVGIGEGAKLLIQLFLKIKELNIDGEVYPVFSKNIENRIVIIKDTEELYEYRFETLWMALNETNYRKYLNAGNEEKQKLLQSVLKGNILSFYKGIGFWAKQNIMLKLTSTEHVTNFKDNKMIAFKGNFVCNTVLPDYIGLGKAVSRGFGTIIQKS